MKIRSVDKQNYPTLTTWLENGFLEVMGNLDIWNKFKLHAHMTEFSARDAVSGGIRSPLLIISDLGDLNGRFLREWPDDIEFAKEIVDRFELDPSNQEAKILVTSTLLSLLVAWRRSKEERSNTRQVERDFLKSAYDPIPSRYWKKKIHPLHTGRERIIDLTETDVDDLIRITVAEAGGFNSREGKNGQAAIIFVVLNRVAASPFPDIVRQVINQQNQFEPVKNNGGSVTLLAPPSQQNATYIGEIIEDIAAGRLLDVTNGATFFQNVTITNQRGTNFAPTSGPVAVINNHSFYNQYKNHPSVVVPPWIITTPKPR